MVSLQLISLKSILVELRRPLRFRAWSLLSPFCVTLVVLCSQTPGWGIELTPLEQLGKQLFFDSNLSNPVGQSCASCHAPEAGFSGPRSEINERTGVYPGATPGRYGSRKPPSAAYASFSPRPTYNTADETWVGGLFWDGRADDLVEQAKGPLLNPLEMNNRSSEAVVNKVRKSRYRALFEQVYGRGSLETASADIPFHQIAQAIAAYESSREVNAFNSRYDAYLAGRITLSNQEQRGLKLFAGKANCSSCHPHLPDPDGTPPLFTDFTYDNLGVPRNEGNPFYSALPAANPQGRQFRDLGIGAVRKDPAHWGKVKVPTLRNVARKPSDGFVKAYFHNGSFKSLKEVVHFYNVSGTTHGEFAAPDVEENVNREELGKLGLTEDEEDDLVAFLETLSDEDQTASNGLFQAVHRTSFRSVPNVLRVERFRHQVQQANGRTDPPRR